MMKYISLSVLYMIFILGCTSRSEMLDNPTFELLSKVEPFYASAKEFAMGNEKMALDGGRELNNNEKDLASNVGVKNVDKIRILIVDEFPFPEDDGLALIAKKNMLDSPKMLGFTYGHGIYIRAGRYSEGLLAHELIHVTQYEALGIEKFIERYLLELAVTGYRNAPLEVEAYNKSNKYY